MHRLFLLTCSLLLIPAAVSSAQPAANDDRILVIPFDNLGQDAGVYWLAEASAILLADNLNAAGRHAYTRDERLEAFDELQVPAVASLSHATVIRLGQLVGATHVVIGSLTLSGTEISVSARDIRLDTGRFESEAVETGMVEDLFGVFDRLTRRLAGLPPGPSLAVARQPSLPVFESYVKGLLANATPTKVGYLQGALKLDPSFDRARLALWAVHQDSGNAQAALLAAAAVPETSPLYARARFDAALSLIQLKRLDDAFAMLKTLADRAPSATLMNNLGVIQLRRPATSQAGNASYYFNEAVKLDPDDPDYYFNLGYAYWAEHNEQGTVYWLREEVRRRPADGEAHAVLAAALQGVGSMTESARERELATQLSSKYAEWAKRPAAGEQVPRGLERVKSALVVTSLQRVDTAIATSGQRDQREQTAFHMDRGRRFFEQGNDGEAIAELRRALYLSPYEAEAHLLLGRIYLRTGQTLSAIDAFKIALWSSESAAAHVAIAQAYLRARNEADARTHAQRALVLAPDSAEARALLDKLAP
jgi:tetratricopeptide (TPR) repeat protein/TolB-like protein